MKVTETVPEDIDAVLEDPLDELVKGNRDLLSEQPAVTAWDDDGGIIFVGGINWYWKGVGEAWVIFHRNAQRHGHRSYRTAKEVLAMLMDKSDYHRVQATARADWPQAVRMLEVMGFHREGLMEKFYPNGADAYMYSMVRR
ncbi:MAG: hypothetical protein GY832_11550 [Chloroflexi bacterium]|nr:hypothetical protein [Chloroflexota bacterium]